MARHRGKDAAATAQKWARGVANSADLFTTGVNAVTVAPTALAAAKADEWQRRVSDPATKERFVNGCQRVSLAAWKDAMLNKGLQRARDGAGKALQKVQNFMSWWLQQVDAARSELDAAVPRGTLDDNIRRSEAFIRYFSQLRGQGKDAARR